MTDTPISGLTELTALAADDWLVVVDRDDPTMDPTEGTDKKIKASNLINPDNLSRLETSLLAPQTGLASDAEEFCLWEAPPGVLVGTDLEVDAMDPTYINVLTDGVYSWGSRVTVDGAFAYVAATLLSTMQGTPQDFFDNTCTTRTVLLTPPAWYFDAGDTFRVSAQCGTSAGTWALSSAYVWVQRLA